MQCFPGSKMFADSMYVGSVFSGVVSALFSSAVFQPALSRFKYAEPRFKSPPFFRYCRMCTNNVASGVSVANVVSEGISPAAAAAAACRRALA